MFELKDGLMSLLIAGSTKAMHGFAFCCLRLQLISERATTVIGEFVPLLLSFPCFKLSHLCFKLAYSLQQGKLVRMGGQNLPLKLNNRTLELGGIAEVHKTLRDVLRSLERSEPAGDH